MSAGAVVAVTFGVGEGQELLQLLIELEIVGGEVVKGPDRLGVLTGSPLDQGCSEVICK